MKELIHHPDSVDSEDVEKVKPMKKSSLIIRLLPLVILAIGTIICIKTGSNLGKEQISIISEIHAIESGTGYYENFKASEKYLMDLQKEDIEAWFN